MYTKNIDFFSDITETNTIYIDMENGLFYLIPPFANLIFRCMLYGMSVNEIIELCSTIPEIPSDYKERINKTIKLLLEYKLIIECDNAPDFPKPELNDYLIQSIQEDDFDYTITPSNDVQKLLLDDPIHDVSLGGWSPIVK